MAVSKKKNPRDFEPQEEARHPEVPLMSAKVIKMSDKERAAKEQREKQEKFAKMVPHIEATMVEHENAAYKARMIQKQVTGLIKECEQYGFKAKDVKQLLQERKTPRTLFDQAWKEERIRMDGMHDIVEKNGVKRAGDYTVNDDFYQRAFRVCLDHKAMNITAGILMDEMGCKFNEAASVLVTLEANGVLSKKDDSGARAVIWQER